MLHSVTEANTGKKKRFKQALKTAKDDIKIANPFPIKGLLFSQRENSFQRTEFGKIVSRQDRQEEKYGLTDMGTSRQIGKQIGSEKCCWVFGWPNKGGVVIK